ncbi:MAG: hypothetical protein KKB37_11340 [Alphaproteobacteria bacterium]|nr:hypothetical protein [Alphaproteobacteria bacterium]
MNKPFTAAKSGFILGTWYENGDAVPVSASQARYLVPPFGDALEVKDAARAARKPAAPKASGKTEPATRD